MEEKDPRGQSLGRGARVRFETDLRFMKGLYVGEDGNLENALLDGPSLEADVSFDCRWHHPIARRRRIRNAAPDQRFTGVFTQTHATVKWSAREAGFEFRSDPAHTSTTVYAEVGEERNGIFFS